MTDSNKTEHKTISRTAAAAQALLDDATKREMSSMLDQLAAAHGRKSDDPHLVKAKEFLARALLDPDTALDGEAETAYKTSLAKGGAAVTAPKELVDLGASYETYRRIAADYKLHDRQLPKHWNLVQDVLGSVAISDQAKWVIIDEACRGYFADVQGTDSVRLTAHLAEFDEKMARKSIAGDYDVRIVLQTEFVKPSTVKWPPVTGSKDLRKTRPRNYVHMHTPLDTPPVGAAAMARAMDAAASAAASAGAGSGAGAGAAGADASDADVMSNCGQCHAVLVTAFRCPCRLVAYCGKACQKKHWKKAHQEVCPLHQRGA